MSPPFWIHCNICSLQFSKDLKIYMLNCSHMLCKNCMNLTERGTKCPLCKKAIKFEELTKLDDNTKAFFKPDITSGLSAPLKKIFFQAAHQKNLFNLSRDYKTKFQKASQAHALVEQDVAKMKSQYEKMVAHRKLMQAKLKEIYTRNQKNREVAYRGISSSVASPMSVSSSRSPSNCETRPNFYQATPTGSGFFLQNAPMMRENGSGGSRSDMGSFISGFSGNSMTSQSYSSRKPFFA